MDLYRYISFEEFMSIITLHHLHFVQPTQWEDTYEGCLYRLLDNKENKEKLLSILYDNVDETDENEKAYRVLLGYYRILSVKYNWYGQCWTYKSEESDAFWRIYSYNKMSIRIRTSDLKLKKILKKEACLVRMKKVTYDNPLSKSDLLESQIQLVLQKDNTTESYFHKRKAFSHEQEYRILVLPKKATNEDQEGRTTNEEKKDKNPNEEQEGRNFFLEAALVFAQMQLGVHVKAKPIKNKGECIATCREIIEAQKFDLKNAPPLYIPFKSASDLIDDVLITPLAEGWYVDLVKEICRQNSIKCTGKSKLYDPVL